MRDRTADLLDANQALSQLSYSPFQVLDTRHRTLDTPSIKSLATSFCFANGETGRPGQT